MSSSNLSLYDLTVPVVTRALEQLSNVLKKGEEWAKENGKDPQTLIDGKIAEDMLALPFQIQTCSNTSKGILFRVGGMENVPMDDNEKTFEDLYKRIDRTVEMLKGAKREKFVAPDTKVFVKSGPMEVEFDALGYIQKFALPNFFFHETTAYLILRQAGVPVGKFDFLGAKDLKEWSL